ncbi:hypothetical protein DFS34DRAFT_593022 [Phlyctochytrium arcticum]|nr:hypothetical protein DFS34DRAFT_593022 [Phlyctochytrium arcticum]
MKDTFDSRSSGSNIVIPIDSNSSYLRPQQGFLSGKVNVFNADGTIYTNATLASVGIAGFFGKRVIICGGKEVDGQQLDDYGQLAWDTYREESAIKKKWLKRYEAYKNPDVFKNAKGEYKFKHIMISGLSDNDRFQPLPLAHLPNKAMEISYSLKVPHNAFVDLPAGCYYKVSDVKYTVMLVTPETAFIAAAWQGIQSGEYLNIPFTGVSQFRLNCSGASLNSFLLPLSNARIKGLTIRFLKAADQDSVTNDKYKHYTYAGLKSLRLNIGAYRWPLNEDLDVDDISVMNSLTMNNTSSFAEEDFDYDDENDQIIKLNFQSMDEDALSALDTHQQNGTVRLTCNFDPAPANIPPVSTSVLVTVYHHKTLLIGNTVDVIN